MEPFEIGDFVRLKNLSNYSIERIFDSELNIFEIVTKDNEFVILASCKSRIPLNHIEPIPINSKDDRKIYYHPHTMAQYVSNSSNANPMITKDYTYYLDAFKNESIDNKTYYELIHENKLKYVHEVQHFLINELKLGELRIDITF